MILAALLAVTSACSRVPHAEAPAPTTRRVPGDLARIETDVRRAASNLGWAVLRPGQVVMPDDRVMHIDAVEVKPGLVEITASVAPFGDRRRETEFLNELVRVLKGPPARQYGGHFELPPSP